MGDAKEILGLRKDVALPLARDKKAKEHVKKPDGISREVFALTGGLPHAIMPTVEGALLKGKKKGATPGGGKVRWGWLPFRPIGRTDITLHHWAKIVEGTAPEAYAFDKYNKQLDIVAYTDEEYSQFLEDKKWTREETDYLFDLLHQYDLRFIIVADRWRLGIDRSVEDLKERYYNIARRLTLARAAYGDESADQHPLAKEPFNVAHEIERKKALKLQLEQSRQQEREEQEVIAEAKRIAETRKVEFDKDQSKPKALPAAEPPRAVAPPPTGARSQPRHPKATPQQATPVAAAPPPPPPAPASSTPRASVGTPHSASTPATKHMPRVYVRGGKLAAWVAQQAQSQGGRIAKRIDVTLEDLKLKPKPMVPTRAVCSDFEKLRKGITYLLAMQKKIQTKEAELVALREARNDGSLSAFGAFEKRPVATRATTAADGEGGEGPSRIGKRSEKRKAPTPARFNEDFGQVSPNDSSLGPPSQKRARKLKVPDD